MPGTTVSRGRGSLPCSPNPPNHAPSTASHCSGRNHRDGRVPSLATDDRTVCEVSLQNEREGAKEIDVVNSFGECCVVRTDGGKVRQFPAQVQFQDRQFVWVRRLFIKCERTVTVKVSKDLAYIVF